MLAKGAKPERQVLLESQLMAENNKQIFWISELASLGAGVGLLCPAVYSDKGVGCKDNYFLKCAPHLIKLPAHAPQAPGVISFQFSITLSAP